MIELAAATAQTPCRSLVLVINDAGKRPCITRTRSEPWALGDGTLVVSLKGRSGGYALSRVFLLPDNVELQGEL